MILPVLSLASLALAYALFALASGQRDPFRRPDASPPRRRRWRYGRRLGAGALGVAVGALGAWRSAGIEPLAALAAGAFALGGVALWLAVSFRRHRGLRKPSKSLVRTLGLRAAGRPGEPSGPPTPPTARPTARPDARADAVDIEL